MDISWIKTLNDPIPFLEYRSLSKQNRHIWIGVRHSHATSELHFILQGSSRIEIEDTTINLQEGQAILIQPDTFHCNTATSEPFLRMSLSFLIEEKYTIPKQTASPYCLFSLSPAIMQTCAEIYEEYDKNDSFWREEMLTALLTKLLIQTFREVRQAQTEKVNDTLEEHSAFQIIDKFFSLSPNPIEKDFSRKALSRALHCSERQLNRLVYSLYGMTFQKKRKLARLDHAKFLLRSTDKPISDIAALVGYANESSFYKLFRNEYNVTPQEFRSIHKKSNP